MGTSPCFLSAVFTCLYECTGRVLHNPSACVGIGGVGVSSVSSSIILKFYISPIALRMAKTLWVKVFYVMDKVVSDELS